MAIIEKTFIIINFVRNYSIRISIIYFFINYMVTHVNFEIYFYSVLNGLLNTIFLERVV